MDSGSPLLPKERGPRTGRSRRPNCRGSTKRCSRGRARASGLMIPQAPNNKLGIMWWLTSHPPKALPPWALPGWLPKRSRSPAHQPGKPGPKSLPPRVLLGWPLEELRPLGYRRGNPKLRKRRKRRRKAAVRTAQPSVSDSLPGKCETRHRLSLITSPSDSCFLPFYC